MRQCDPHIKGLVNLLELWSSELGHIFALRDDVLHQLCKERIGRELAEQAHARKLTASYREASEARHFWDGLLAQMSGEVVFIDDLESIGSAKSAS